MSQSDIRWLPYKRSPIKIVRGIDGLWRDSEGTIYSVEEAANSVNGNDNRCGIGVFSLPRRSSLNSICRSHDHAYSSTAYQLFYTREEADRYLREQLTKAGAPIVAKVFYILSRLFGASFWEGRRDGKKEKARSTERTDELRIQDRTERAYEGEQQSLLNPDFSGIDTRGLEKNEGRGK